MNKFTCFCGNTKYTETNRLINCYECKGLIHESCYGYHLKNELKDYEKLCGECHLKEIDPLNIPERVVLPCYKNGFKKSFLLDSNVYEKVKNEKTSNIQLRVFKLGTFKELNYPKYGMIKINAKIVKTLTQPPENTSARKRKDYPIYIRDFIKRGNNEIEINVTNDKETYIIELLMTKYITPDVYSQKIKSEGHAATTVLECYERLRRLNRPDDDVEFVNKLRRYSIKDPISMTLIKTPVRGEYCEHIDCFSLETWAIMQENSNIYRWRCPICKKKAYKLKIDQLWIQILQEAEELDDPMEVEFNEQHKYRIITFKDSNAGLGKLTATLNTVHGVTEQIHWVDPLTRASQTQDDKDENEIDYASLLKPNSNFVKGPVDTAATENRPNTANGNSNNLNTSASSEPLNSDHLRMKKMGLEDSQPVVGTGDGKNDGVGVNVINNPLKRKRENNAELNEYLADYSKLKKSGNKEEPIEL